ncbi:MAG: ester cyclase [Deltaproteobacteria bacterium]|nr:ester cyclase [Deltaproteobacteria bacterium]
MTSENIKANEKRFFHEYVNNRDIKSMEYWIDQFVAEDFVNHTPQLDLPKNRDGLKEMFRLLFQLFPNMKIVINEMAFDEDILFFRYVIRGIRADSEINGLAMVKYRDDKITDRWAITEPI